MSCKGYKHSIEARKKIRKFKLGDKNPMWKGNEVGYVALHNWVRGNKYKPKLCERCKKNKPYDLANISGEYKRDINDFEWLCRSCHMKKDGRINRLHKSMVISKNKKTRKKFNKAKSLFKKGMSYENISKELGYYGRGSSWNLLHNKNFTPKNIITIDSQVLLSTYLLL